MLRHQLAEQAEAEDDWGADVIPVKTADNARGFLPLRKVGSRNLSVMPMELQLLRRQSGDRLRIDWTIHPPGNLELPVEKILRTLSGAWCSMMRDHSNEPPPEVNVICRVDQNGRGRLPLTEDSESAIPGIPVGMKLTDDRQRLRLDWPHAHDGYVEIPVVSLLQALDRYTVPA
jgi:hypothetical protein